MTFCLLVASSLSLLSLKSCSILDNLSLNCFGSLFPKSLITSGVLNASEMAACVALN